MRRWLLRIVLLVVLVAALMSLAVGLIVEKQFPEAIANLNSGGTPWTLRAERFERGWWTSRVSVIAEGARGERAWRYRDRLSHGPWMLSLNALGWIGGQGSLEGPRGEPLALLLWRLTPWLDFEGQLDFSPPGQPDGRIEFAVRERLSRVDFQITQLSAALAEVAGLDSLDGSGWGTLKDGRIGARLELTARRGFWPEAVVDGPVFSVSLDQEADLLNLEVSIGAAHAAFDQSYRDASGGVRMERLHRPTLERLLDSLLKVVQAELPPAMRDRQLGELLLLSLPGLLAHQPLLEIQQLRTHAPQGALSGRAAIALVKPPPAGYLMNPATLIPALESRWEVDLPTALTRRWLRHYLRARGEPAEQAAAAAEEVLADLSAKGLIVVRGERLTSEGVLEEQALTVNGRPFLLTDPPPEAAAEAASPSY